MAKKPNPFAKKGKGPSKKMTASQDAKADKAKGIKPGSKKDKALDKKNGVKY